MNGVMSSSSGNDTKVEIFLCRPVECSNLYKTHNKQVKGEQTSYTTCIRENLILAVMLITFVLTVGSTIHFQLTKKFFKSYMYVNSQKIPPSTCKNVPYNLIFILIFFYLFSFLFFLSFFFGGGLKGWNTWFMRHDSRQIINASHIRVYNHLTSKQKTNSWNVDSYQKRLQTKRNCGGC